MRTAGVSDPAPHFEAYRTINRSLWAGVERGELGPDDVRVVRFQQLGEQVDLDVDPVAAADAFVAGLGAHGELYPGARAVLVDLAPVATLALVTNGIGEVQRARIARLELEPFFEAIVISGEVGVSKPRKEIFDIAFAQLNEVDRSSTLMIGDSLTSDMQGGANFGIDTCWYNPGRRPGTHNGFVTHEIADLAHVRLLADGAALD